MAKKESIRRKSAISSMSALDEAKTQLEQESEQEETQLTKRLLADVDCLTFHDDQIRVKSAGEWIENNTKIIKSLCKRCSWFGEPDDIYQEICLAIIRAFGTYDDHQYDVKDTTYYWTCAMNGVKHVYRKTQAKKWQFDHCKAMEFTIGSVVKSKDEDGVVAVITGSAEDSLLESESFEFWMKAIDKLPKNQRKIMLLTIKGLTQVEIAEKMGKGQSFVSYNLNRARTTLNELRKAGK